MKFAEALNEIARGNRVRRKAWGPGHQGLSGPRSAITLEDTMSNDWETVKTHLSDVKAGDEFTIDGHLNTYKLVDARYLRPNAFSEYKFFYVDTKTYTLHANPEDVTVKIVSHKS